MDFNAYLNVVLQFFGFVFSIVIIIFLMASRRRLTNTAKHYIVLLIVNMILQTCNMLSWILEGNMYPLIRGIYPLINFSMYLFTYLLLGTFANYFLSIMERKNIPIGKTKKYVWILVGQAILLLVVAYVTGAYFTIDSQNLYHRGEYYGLSNIVGLICLIPCITKMIQYIKKYKMKELIIFFSYLVIIVLSSFVLMLTMGSIFIHIMTTFVIISIYMFIQVEEARNISEMQLVLEKSNTALMVSQIQPHFLFNVLTCIMQLCEEDSKMVYPALEHFSYFLRRNLDSIGSDELILFEKEISHVEDYLYLEKIRFQERLRIVYDFQYVDFSLPPLSIQPIVENSVRHGITKRQKGGEVTIQSRRVDDYVCVSIRDDGVGFDPMQKYSDDRNHIGIQNIKKRLGLLCNGTLTIKSEIGIGTWVELWIPLRKEK